MRLRAAACSARVSLLLLSSEHIMKLDNVLEVLRDSPGWI